MKHIEGLDPGMEKLVLARLVAIKLVRYCKLGVEAASEDKLKHREVLVGDGPAALHQLPHPAGVIAQPDAGQVIFHIAMVQPQMAGNITCTVLVRQSLIIALDLKLHVFVQQWQ